MERDSTQSSGLIRLLAWLELNKKRLLIWGGAILGVVIVVVVTLLLQKQRQTRASEALSEVKTYSESGAAPPESLAEDYLKIARDFAGTAAAGRALLLHAETLYDDGKYTEAQTQFEEFLRLNPNSPWIPQGLFGVAASLDAQQKADEAMSKYEELRRRFQANPIVDQARLSLARLYENANRLEEAYQIYEELTQTHSGAGLGSEAGMRLEDLLNKHPELARTNEPSLTTLTPSVATLTSAPPLMVTNTAATPTNPVPVPVPAPSTSQPPVEIELPAAPTNPAPTNPAPTPDPSS